MKLLFWQNLRVGLKFPSATLHRELPKATTVIMSDTPSYLDYLKLVHSKGKESKLLEYGFSIHEKWEKMHENKCDDTCSPGYDEEREDYDVYENRYVEILHAADKELGTSFKERLLSDGSLIEHFAWHDVLQGDEDDFQREACGTSAHDDEHSLFEKEDPGRFTAIGKANYKTGYRLSGITAIFVVIPSEFLHLATQVRNYYSRD